MAMDDMSQVIKKSSMKDSFRMMNKMDLGLRLKLESTNTLAILKTQLKKGLEL